MMQAYSRNRRIQAAHVKQKSQALTRKGESSDGGGWCGRIRSSDEASVMEGERRDSVVYTSGLKQPATGGLDERRKVV